MLSQALQLSRRRKGNLFLLCAPKLSGILYLGSFLYSSWSSLVSKADSTFLRLFAYVGRQIFPGLVQVLLSKGGGYQGTT